MLCMPRRTAVERHSDSSPNPNERWPLDETALVDALVALHHPARRRLYEVLSVEGPGSVGLLASRTGLAPGSVSHHLKPLHRSGFVEPAPDLAHDTRESWWRALHRRLSWDPEDYSPGTAGREIADVAEQANQSHQEMATVAWLRHRDRLPAHWRRAGWISDSYVRATPDQAQALGERVEALVQAWVEECRQDAAMRPDVERRPVRFIGRVFPSEPVQR